jgi:hypothetical protein
MSTTADRDCDGAALGRRSVSESAGFPASSSRIRLVGGSVIGRRSIGTQTGNSSGLALGLDLRSGRRATFKPRAAMPAAENNRYHPRWREERDVNK